jgi:hypothetical protein
MKDERATDIEDLQKRLAECKRAPWTSWLSLLLLLSLGAVVYYIVDGMSDTTLLICGIIGTVLGGFMWLKLYPVYKHLAQFYEETLAAKRKELGLVDSETAKPESGSK